MGRQRNEIIESDWKSVHKYNFEIRLDAITDESEICLSKLPDFCKVRNNYEAFELHMPKGYKNDLILKYIIIAVNK